MKQLQIGICDDDKNIRSCVKEWIEQRERECDITEFSSGEALMNWMEGSEAVSLDILFLDIAMGDPGELNGMTAARKLRERQTSGWGSLPLLIFVTGYTEYMPEAFGVHAFQYMVKPVRAEEFQNVFRQAVQEVRRLRAKEQEKPREILLKNGSIVRRVPIDEICYVEGNNRKVIVCLLHEKIEYYARLGDLERELGPSFFRIHKGYLVHMKYVERYDRKQVFMKNQDCLLLSRYKYQEFVHAYMDYLTGETL